jgi:hypothetical protein
VKRVTWPDVLRAAQGSRDSVLAAYRAAEFGSEDFARLRPAREAMADALTRAEDRLETKRGAVNAAEREAIRGVRCRLELELWP